MLVRFETLHEKFQFWFPRGGGGGGAGAGVVWVRSEMD